MPTEIAKTNGHGPLPEAIERALISGDLASLSTNERLAFYHSRCQAAGLDPRAQPFEYLNLNGKLKLYATKSATDQLIAMHHLTVELVERKFETWSGCYEVRCRVAFPDGHTVEDIGVVAIPEKITGEPLANAMMKAVTKAKRRTVLSACGLGMLDESEVESIPEARVVAPEPVQQSRIEGPRQVPMDHPKEVRPVYSEPIKSKPRSEFRQFCESRVDGINDNWRNILSLENPPKDALFKPICNIPQLGNHIIKVWVAGHNLSEADVSTDGKRDRAKVGVTLTRIWETSRSEVELEVARYLHGLLTEAAKTSGVEMPERSDGDVWDEDYGSVPVATA